MKQRRLDTSLEIDVAGLPAPLVWNRVEQSIRSGFEAMNQALKACADAQAGKE